jgi:acrylyl-CoA reductase (NADPH)
MVLQRSIYEGDVMEDTFKALVVNQTHGAIESSIQAVQHADLPEGDVLISVAYSSLNYKDALAVTGKGKVIRRYPMVPGIDLAGTVVESASPDFKTGDQVILTGWGLGEHQWGGYAQMARARAEWLVPLPDGLTLRQAMGIGTAGLTAMLCLMALETHGLTPQTEQEVVVSGASGGVGSLAVAILAQSGYNVVASTGRAESRDYLRRLGARSIIDRATLAAPSSRPLESARWAGAIDTVGGETLASIIRALAYRASVAACGLVGGSDLPTTVFPFILRGVNLLGIDSGMCPMPQRRAAWSRLAHDLPLDRLELIIQEAPLADVPQLSEAILQGRIRGRVVIDVNA